MQRSRLSDLIGSFIDSDSDYRGKKLIRPWFSSEKLALDGAV